MRSAHSEEDIDSLPPAVRRKFFSNVERLRMRLAQDAPGGDYARIYRSNNAHGPVPLHSRGLRTTPPGPRSPRRRGLEKRTASPKKLRKLGSLQSAYWIAQADSQCFHALPAKIQQKLFSPEERRRLRLAYRESVILDAADQAFYRRDSRSRRNTSTESLPSGTASVDRPTSVFWDSDSDSDLNSHSDWDIDDEVDVHADAKMDQSLYDTFRWIDGDGDLNLSLDEYHSHVADAATTKAISRRRPSFRRSLSFSTHVPKHRQTASVPPRSIPPSHSLPPFAPLINRNSIYRPTSRQQSSHAPKSSTSSIDPSAQYYQDPDARLKLRVYLASPQKFDEAIEFGFPALDQNKENLSPEPKSPSPILVNPEYAGTFFEDDDGIMVGSPGGSVMEEAAPSMASQMRETPRPSVDAPSLLQPRQSFMSGSRTGPQRLPGNREMTLKMTLTRPDLRTESPTSPSSEDPLRLAALPPADRNQHIWDDLDDDQGMVKKMWRRLRRRN